VIEDAGESATLSAYMHRRGRKCHRFTVHLTYAGQWCLSFSPGFGGYAAEGQERLVVKKRGNQRVDSVRSGYGCVSIDLLGGVHDVCCFRLCCFTV